MTAPLLDPRSYEEIRDEVVARIPVHNEEWTNPGPSDPGVTVLELFSFMAEAIAYRANLVPDRNRRRFLSLLGVPRSPGASARGIVTIANERGPLTRATLSSGLEVRAGEVAFRTELGLDVLPVEARAYVKRRIAAPDPQLLAYHQHLYASYEGERPNPSELVLYETVPVDPRDPGGAALAAAADGSLWIALLTREGDPVAEDTVRDARQALGGAVLSLGLVPIVDSPRARLGPAVPAGAAATARLDLQVPLVPPGGLLPAAREQRRPRYRSLPATWTADVVNEPGVVELELPPASELELWANLDPLEAGVGDFPPALEDTALAGRVVTWLRLTGAAGTDARFLWVGINAVMVRQGARIEAEALPPGDGEPDQVARLAAPPVVPGTVSLTVDGAEWAEVDDLTAGGPELPGGDAVAPPGTRPEPTRRADVYALDHATGEIRFGDGWHGRRPRAGATLRATYASGLGAAGNVAAGAIGDAPALPTGMKVTNPLRTWGGAEPESIATAERHAARYLQHRERAVTREDFEAIAWRTPGAELGRVDVLAAFSPELAPSPPGDAAGAVTVIVAPQSDARHPDAPEPDRLFLDAVCRHLDARRLVTTEVFVRGPSYRSIWIAVGIELVAGVAEAELRTRVADQLRAFLAPVDPEAPPWPEPREHWPLGQDVVRLELLAVANRVPGVRLVRDVLLAEGAGGPVERVELGPLELPRVLDVAVAIGDPSELDAVRGTRPPSDPPPFMPVPVVPESC